ncbi:hypothetical protein HYP06_gp087 [Vibrio phage vB_VspP_pVa5]|uniref:Uncharacterized protein n=1 Tax=Vibrio phage vB_VspP_pVa5 TaxID=1913109 RepID=A0A1J0GV91_9CAUD|nr:hypothetical protein HYP06_gp087 [Vibrio phage vB_VspP_pVa5]APC46093.1 hypothetical protein vBVspPpVa5_0086 [Vibrio phage vB_VspP_pVa5]
MNDKNTAINRLIDLTKHNDLKKVEHRGGEYDYIPMLLIIQGGGEPTKLKCEWTCSRCPLALGRGWKDVVAHHKMEKLMDE